MHTILLVGADALLLHTRAAILGNTGAEVVCSDAASALAHLADREQADREFDLVVLCHSLPAAVCVSLAKVVRARWPKTRILEVVALKEWGSAEARAAVDGISSPEPARLIGTTAELLRRAATMDAREIAVRGGTARAGPFAN